MSAKTTRHIIARKSFIKLAAGWLLVVSTTMLSGCTPLDSMFAFFGFGGGYTRPDTAESLTMEALDNFNHGKYGKAVETFEDLRDRYPFTRFSLLAELKMADCRYYMNEYEEALILYEEFENNHPTNEAIPYVMFQTGMCHYKQIDTIDRDPGGAYDAIQAFTRLLRTFPKSPYSEETKARIMAAQDFLASHEFYVADFYIRTAKYKQAEGRLDYLVTNYPEASSAPHAEELLAALRSDNPPKRTWKSWLPEISLPDWQSFKSLTLGTGAGE